MKIIIYNTIGSPLLVSNIHTYEYFVLLLSKNDFLYFSYGDSGEKFILNKSQITHITFNNDYIKDAISVELINKI
jgi:hypothetical protein